MPNTASLLAQAAGFEKDARSRSPSRQGRSPSPSPVNFYAPISFASACPFATSADLVAAGKAAPHPIARSVSSDSGASSSSGCSYSSSVDVLGSSPFSNSSLPSSVEKEVLEARLKEEVAKGVLVENDDASGLYLPPLLSLLPESISSSGYSTRYPSGTNTPASISPTPLSSPPTAAVQYTLTRLPSIDAVSLSLHAALHSFRPVTPHYAISPYASAFNWEELVLEDVSTAEGDVVDVVDEEHEWYIVAFRSRRRRDLEENEARELYEKDRAAHEEAVSAHGGLIAYWFGSPVPLSPSPINTTSSSFPASSAVSTSSASNPFDLSGRNLATCIWSSRAHALAAMKGPKHAAAARLAHRTYESYTLERYTLRKERGSRSVRVVPWQDPEEV
ncbi:hypothetical protein JCM11251_004697 [Rhodosporidiobolus azoricus]